ncbi:MAG: thiol-disulfide oxidoreductase DCC family protein [Ginsengibacter sp.]|jgi:predicted DCC family thiol-disulfide oxidoreductase YuxK
MPQQPIILFDGVCNFCDSTVNFVIKRDRKNLLKFAVLQSSIAKELLEGQSIQGNDLSSFIFIENKKVYSRSTAALRVCKYLNGFWPFMYGFIIVPKFIRDAVYNLIARNRYKWFGKKDACMIPTPEMKERFLTTSI